MLQLYTTVSFWLCAMVNVRGGDFDVWLTTTYDASKGGFIWQYGPYSGFPLSTSGFASWVGGAPPPPLPEGRVVMDSSNDFKYRNVPSAYTTVYTMCEIEKNTPCQPANYIQIPGAPDCYALFHTTTYSYYEARSICANGLAIINSKPVVPSVLTIESKDEWDGIKKYIRETIMKTNTVGNNHNYTTVPQAAIEASTFTPDITRISDTTLVPSTLIDTTSSATSTPVLTELKTTTSDYQTTIEGTSDIQTSKKDGIQLLSSIAFSTTKPDTTELPTSMQSTEEFPSTQSRTSKVLITMSDSPEFQTTIPVTSQHQTTTISDTTEFQTTMLETKQLTTLMSMFETTRSKLNVSTELNDVSSTVDIIDNKTSAVTTSLESYKAPSTMLPNVKIGKYTRISTDTIELGSISSTMHSLQNTTISDQSELDILNNNTLSGTVTIINNITSIFGAYLHRGTESPKNTTRKSNTVQKQKLYTQRILRPTTIKPRIDTRMDPDKRPFAIAVGTTSVIIVIMFAVFVVIIDLSSIIRDLRKMKRNIHSFIRYYGSCVTQKSCV